MIRDQIMQMANSDPKFAQAVDVMEKQVAHMPIVPKDLDKEIQLLEFVLQNPDKYAEVRAAAIQDGYIQADMVPEQFDQVFVVSLLVALYGLQDRLQQQGYARGGLRVAGRELAEQGRGGDDMVAHINHREAEVLRRMGGAGTINPNTGLHEYKKGKGILGAILPIALSFIAPGLGTAIGTALGASGAFASGLGGAIIGGATSALTGGNPLIGAVTGGIMPAVSGAFGGSDGLFSKMGITGENGMLSNVFGGGQGADVVPTNNPGGWGAGAPGDVSLPTTNGGMPPIAPEGLRTFDPSSPLASVSSSLNTGFTPPSMSDAVTAGLPPDPNVVSGLERTNPFTQTAGTGGTASPSSSVIDTIKNGLGFGSTGAKDAGLGFNSNTLMKLAPLALMASSMGGQKAPASVAASMSPEQQAYFNKPGYSWDWDKLQRDAANSGTTVQDYISNNWNDVTSGKYNAGAASGVPTVTAAHGGALNSLARGAGSGRDDKINARLSDGEYVMDAETVALLGDGSTDAGAKRLDEMRKQVRMQKGKQLAKGKFSPDAKSPLAYLKGVA